MFRIPVAPLALALLALTLGAPLVEAAPEDPPIPADCPNPVTTASGLVYSVLTAGKATGAPKEGDTVRVHYTGWFLQGGKMFDSTRVRGVPAELVVGKTTMIAGWLEAVQLMTPGAHWKLTLPPALAYGEKGADTVIPPNATLVFDVELLAVLPTFHRADAARQRVTPTGMKVEDLTAGEGDLPAPTDIVELRYAVWLASGVLVDSSEQRDGAGQTLKFPGSRFPLLFMKDIVPAMRRGQRVRLEVPPALAFGAEPYRRAARDAVPVPPNSVTVWELELVGFKPPLAAPPFALSAPGAARKTETGLEIEMLEEGTGRSPKMNELVTVHYAGWLKSGGTPFDSSYQRGEPMSFMVGEVIGGWNEGLQLMKEGGRARLTIPAALAYGARGQPPSIGPNQDLVFYIELIKVGR